MKTIETIIERLSKVPSNNGCYAVLQAAIEDLEKTSADFERYTASTESIIWLRSLDKKNLLHGKITGFLWGLRATDFISREEFDSAYAEQMEAV